MPASTISNYADKATEQATRINDAVDVALLAIVEDSILTVLVLTLSLFLLTRITRGWRYTATGVQKDESVLPVMFIGIGGLLITGMIMAVYFDLKGALFGGILSHTWILG